MPVVVFLLYEGLCSRDDQQPRWVVAADQLPAALAAVHQCGLRELEVRTTDGRPPAHADLVTRYLTTDEFCGFHVYEAAVTFGGVELVRTRYTVPECACAAMPHRLAHA